MKYFIGIILLGIIGYLVWFAPVKIPEGKVLLNKSYLDSLRRIASLPPDTVEKRDTIWKHKLVYIHDTPPIPKDSSLKSYTYEDSLKTSELLVYLKDSISRKGIILDRKWSYRLFVPLLLTREITITKPYPMPCPVDRIVKIQYKYFGGVGYNLIGGGMVGELGVIKNRFIFGIEGGKNFGVVKVGIMF